MDFILAHTEGCSYDMISVPVDKIQGILEQDNVTYIYACNEWLITEKYTWEVRQLILEAKRLR